MNIGENIKKYRLLKNFTRKDLAKELEVSESTISRYENGKREPNMETLNKIATALNIDLNDLLESNVILSKKILAYLERPMLKTVDYGNILTSLSEILNIDYNLLDNCINKDTELSVDIQKKLLDCLSDIDYPLFVEFIERYKGAIQKSDELNRYVTELFALKIYDLDKNSIELLRSYILLVFDKKVSRLLNDDILHRLQKDITKFLEFKLYEIEKDYYDKKETNE